MIVLTSDGLTSNRILDEINKRKRVISGQAALVTTASGLRERDDNVPVLTSQMREMGLEAYCVDVEFENPARLLSCDVVILMGGDPFVLLYHLRKWPHSEKILKELADRHVLVGISAGSMVLGKSIGFSAEIEETQGSPQDGDGYGLFDFCVMPHYTAYQTIFPELDKILETYREREHLRIETINDGEAMVCRRRNSSYVYLEDEGYYPAADSSFQWDAVDVVVFDLYGTLIDIYTNEDKNSLWEKMALFYSYQGAYYTPSEMKQTYEQLMIKAEKKRNEMQEDCPEIRIEEIFYQMYHKKGVKAGKELVRCSGQMFRALSTEYIRLYYGAKELLTGLKEAGKQLVLLSNAQRLFTEYEMKMLGIYDLFDGIYLSSDAGCKKPSVRFFERMLNEAPHTGQFLFIGNDGEADIRPARELGLYTCYIHSNLSPGDEKEVDCDIYMGHMNLPALTDFLLQ